MGEEKRTERARAMHPHALIPSEHALAKRPALRQESKITVFHLECLAPTLGSDNVIFLLDYVIPYISYRITSSHTFCMG